MGCRVRGMHAGLKHLLEGCRVVPRFSWGVARSRHSRRPLAPSWAQKVQFTPGGSSSPPVRTKLTNASLLLVTEQCTARSARIDGDKHTPLQTQHASFWTDLRGQRRGRLGRVRGTRDYLALRRGADRAGEAPAESGVRNRRRGRHGQWSSLFTMHLWYRNVGTKWKNTSSLATVEKNWTWIRRWDFVVSIRRGHSNHVCFSSLSKCKVFIVQLGSAWFS